MSEVALVPRTAGRPTHSTGTPLDFSDARSSPRSSWCRVRPSARRGIRRGRSASARSSPARRSAARRCRRHRPATVRYRPACRRALRGVGAIRLRRFAVAGLASGLALASFLSVFLSALLVGLLGRRLADRDAVVEAEHDDDGVRLLGGEDALGGGGPVGRIALGLILDQAGDGLVLADHAHVGLFGIGILETVGEPVGHGVAEHQHVALRHGVGSRFSGGGALEKSSRTPLAAPAAGTARRGRRRTSRRRRRCAAAAAAAAAEPPKLKNCAEAGPTMPTSSAIATASAISGPVSVNTAQKGLRLRHAARSQWVRIRPSL